MMIIIVEMIEMTSGAARPIADSGMMMIVVETMIEADVTRLIDAVIEALVREIDRMSGIDGRPGAIDIETMIEAEMIIVAGTKLGMTTMIGGHHDAIETIDRRVSTIGIERSDEICRGKEAVSDTSGVEIYVRLDETGTRRDVGPVLKVEKGGESPER